MTVVVTAAETPDQTAVAEKEKAVRHTAPQESDQHRLPPESGGVDHVQATLRPTPRNRSPFP
ncbi:MULTISPECIES: hypothetical protein [Streptomyces]|uniref:hypothetical protein n=1 Tax=Streptomyces TaxID=1883 RepID=UPI0016287EC4|nr:MULTISPECIES: hypothetical protein [Streptomyces]